MEEEPGVHNAQARLAPHEQRRTAHDGQTGAGEALAIGGRADLLRRDGLPSEGEGRGQHGREPEVHVPDVVGRENRVADLLVEENPLRRGDEAEGPQVAVLLLRQIVPQREAVREPRQRRVGDGPARHEPLDSCSDRLVEERVDHDWIT